MGLVCAPIQFLFDLLQASIDFAYFFLGFFGFPPAPPLSDAIGSILGCNL
jgi:hypothetical protein